MGPDTRWSFFQTPVLVEDALGFRFPVPSEYDFDILDAVVKQRFSKGPGSIDVEAGNYEYVNTKDNTKVLTTGSRLMPGMSITMAILISPMHPITQHDEICPMPNCGSFETTVELNGSRLW
jgi:hypothetical protein